MPRNEKKIVSVEEASLGFELFSWNGDVVPQVRYLGGALFREEVSPTGVSKYKFVVVVCRKALI